jgi:hypothetical protein
VPLHFLKVGDWHCLLPLKFGNYSGALDNSKLKDLLGTGLFKALISQGCSLMHPYICCLVVFSHT